MRSTAGADLPAHGLPAIGRQLAVIVWWTALVLQVMIASLLAMRRLAGAFVEPLGGLEFVGATVVLVLGAALVQLSAARERIVFLVPAMAAAIGLTALTLPGTAPWSAGLSWFGLVAAQAATLLVCLKPSRRNRLPAAPLLSIEEAAEEAISEHLVQQLTRERNAAGGETLHALVRVSCPAGDLLAVVHLAFCPPLDAQPKLIAHTLGGSGAEAKVMLAETYGARIEIRFPRRPTPSETVLLEVVGEAAPAL